MISIQMILFGLALLVTVGAYGAIVWFSLKSPRKTRNGSNHSPP